MNFCCSSLGRGNDILRTYFFVFQETHYYCASGVKNTLRITVELYSLAEAAILCLNLIQFMVKNLLLFSLMLLSSVAFAQLSLDISSPTIHGDGGVRHDIMVEVEVTNTSTLDINLLWTRHEIAKPTMWKTRIGNFTWDTDIAPEGDAIHISPGESYTIQMHAKTYGQAGYAQVELDLYDAESQERVLGVVKATFEAADGDVRADAMNSDAIRIYPNPTNDFFRIYQSEAVDRIEIYNIVGKRIVAYPASQNGQYDVIDLQDGMYLVRLLAADKSVIKTVRLSKN
jgi:type IX secretion system substrate protein